MDQSSRTAWPAAQSSAFSECKPTQTGHIASSADHSSFIWLPLSSAEPVDPRDTGASVPHQRLADGFQPTNVPLQPVLHARAAGAIMVTLAVNASQANRPSCRQQHARGARCDDLGRAGAPPNSKHLQTAAGRGCSSMRLQDGAQVGLALPATRPVACQACSRAQCARSPIERVKMDLVLHGKQGTVQTARAILRHEGVLAFWHGNGLNVLRTAPFKAPVPLSSQAT